MRKKKRIVPVTRQQLLQIFSLIDNQLQRQRRRISITTIGGASIILQGFRDRATLDIDIINNPDAILFQKICSKMGVPVDIVTIASTVDFDHASTTKLFHGHCLSVHSVVPKDLIKLKLERFYKQDPEDIYAIIEKTDLSYDDFKALVKDMLPDFIGNPRELLLSAWLVVERMYADQSPDFKTSLGNLY